MTTPKPKINIAGLPEWDASDSLDSEEEIAAFLAEAGRDGNSTLLASTQGYVDRAHAEHFSEQLASLLEADNDDGAATKAHLAVGRPIYYWDDELQANVRERPDGRCEVVSYDAAGQLVVVRVV